MDVKVTVSDARKLSYCLAGCRKVCRKYGINFREFIRCGIDADELREIDDAQIKKLIEAAEHGE
jgi:hypothetical protein